LNVAKDLTTIQSILTFGSNLGGSINLEKLIQIFLELLISQIPPLDHYHSFVHFPLLFYVHIPTIRPI